MQTFKYKYLICEFPVSNFFCFPEKSTIPRNAWNKIHLSGKYLHKAIQELCLKYDVKIVFSNNKKEAERACVSIISEISGYDYENLW